MADAEKKVKPESDLAAFTEVTSHDEGEIVILNTIQKKAGGVAGKVENHDGCKSH